ncbi:MAG: site-2 protease family protein [Candidatus Eremiobacteraeota bacterium]|nr:site-2 protease family protein [Candidatus Eremiobacteraeota bacterium]
MHEPRDPNSNVPANPYTRRWSADTVEGEYQAPPQDRAKGLKNAGGGAAVALGLLLAKFKTVLFFLAQFKFLAIGLKLFSFAGSFFVSVWLYALLFGWKFAFVFLLMIAIHEFGHLAMMRFYGVPGTLPFFIPFMGAFVNMKGRPASVLHEAYIALAGPLTGTAIAVLCFLYGQQTHSTFWIAIAYTGFFLNLFNLAPLMPLDGGRVVGAISPRIWIFGLVLFIVAVFAFHIYNPLIFLLVLLSLPQVIAAWKGRIDPQYYGLTALQRGGVALAYFSLAAFLFGAMLSSHISTPHPASVS